MKVLIVEDETAAYENLAQMITTYDPTVEIVANTESVMQTVRWLKNNPKPDLIFMDIHLSDGSAFTIFEMIDVEVPIVFTTAFDQYAIDAFRVNSIDYLLKPIKPVGLANALEKFRKLSLNDVNIYLKQLATFGSEQNYSDRILIRHKDKLIPIDAEQIAFAYNTDRVTHIYLNDGAIYKCDKSLEQLSAQLDPSLFMRVNKQFLLSRHSVKDVTIWFDNRLRVNVNQPAPEDIYISKNRSQDFKVWLIGDKNIKRK